MSIVIAPIVEGHGDVEALPVLIRRLLTLLNPPEGFEIARPIRIPKSKLLRSNELERAVQFAAKMVGDRGGVLIVLDSDDDCPAEVGPQIVVRASQVHPHIACGVALIKSEFEAFFLAGATSLRGYRGLSKTLDPPDNPEGIRGAKEWLTARMPSAAAYRETLHQAALAAVVDLDEVRRLSPSFRKLEREISRLCQQ